MTPKGIGLIEWLARGGSADGAATDATAYAVASKSILLANTGTGRLLAGQRIKFAGDDNAYTLKHSVADVSGAGLATAATTNAAGYAIGATSITLSAAGTGSLLIGNVITFAGDATNYIITSTLNSVAIGGAINIEPGLLAAIPAVATALTAYNAVTLEIGLIKALPASATGIYSGGEIKRGWGFSGLQNPSGLLTSQIESPYFQDWYAAGEVAQLFLDHRYSRLDAKADDKLNRSIATSGASQTQLKRQAELYSFLLNYVEDHQRSDATVSDYDALKSMFQAFVHGGLVAWWPDYDTFPSEFYWCTLEKTKDARRVNTLGLFAFEFDLRIEVGTPVGIPSF